MATDWLQALPDIVQAGGTLLNLFTKRRASKEVPALDSLLQTSARQNEISGALSGLSDPNNVLRKNIEAISREKALEQASLGLMELMRQHRRAQARGNIGALVNPERRDEAVASAFMRSLGGLEQQRTDAELANARNYLLASSQALGQGAQGYAQAIPIQGRFGDIDYNRRAAIPGALAEMLGHGIKIYNQVSTPTPSFGGNFGVGSYGQFDSPVYGINQRRY